MDLKRVKSLRLMLTGHFAVISWLTAMLVASGSGSFFLPVLIFFCSLVAFVFVDCLERFELKSFTGAIAMTLATGAAIAQYVYSVVNASEEGQLMAVAGLLVYPEAVLFLQRKNLRVFEQLAIFLLLEMVVAALVNDNLLFGLLLAPIMLIWVSSLFLFSRYATLVKIDSSIEVQYPKLAELLFRRFMKTVMGDSKKQPVVAGTFVASKEVQSSSSLRRTLQSIPIGVGALAFAALFFYLVPRVSSSNFGSAIGATSSIGLPDRLTFGNIGRMLQNPAPVMRVTFRDRLSKEPFRPEAPPYLRARLFDYYGVSSRTKKGEWASTYSLNPRKLGGRKFLPRLSGNLDDSDPNRGPRSINESDERDRLKSFGREPVRVEFEMRAEFGNEMFTIPPIFATSDKQKATLSYDDKLMLLQKQDSLNVGQGNAIKYSTLSAAFIDNELVSTMPATVSLNPRSIGPAYEGLRRRLTTGFENLSEANAYRKALLASQAVAEDSKITVAQTIARHLAFSGEFGYSLDLKPPSDADLDPVEDFLLNQKVGHCQYFATAMVCMLRQSGIPSRLVVGYRPTEFNTLGNYFTVRQRDAHAWVEALFRHDELENSILRNELTDDAYYWVRFDPTPPPDGELEITEQDGQAMDYAEKLWQEYIVEGQNLASDSGIYAPVSESTSSYAKMVEQLRDAIQSLTTGQGFGRVGFAWPIAILIVILGVGAICVWQLILLLPRLAPGLALKLGIIKDEMNLYHPFYAKCLKLLSRLGLRRAKNVTPAEYVRSATEILSAKGQDADQAMEYLTKLYYRLRFGKDQQLSSAEEQLIQDELAKVESAVSQARKQN